MSASRHSCLCLKLILEQSNIKGTSGVKRHISTVTVLKAQQSSNRNKDNRYRENACTILPPLS